MSEWDDVLTAFKADLIDMGRSHSTARVIVQRVRHLPTAVGPDPIHALADRVQRSMRELEQSERNTRSVAAEVGAVRTFYAWTVSTGRRASDPTVRTPILSASRNEAAWSLALDHWAADQRATRLSASTIAQRRKYVSRLARTLGRVS